MNIDRLPKVLASYRYNFSSEADLQAAIEQILHMEGFEYMREVKLSDKERIDFLVRDGKDMEKAAAGLEVKIRFGPNDVIRQLQRYAYIERITQLFLVTTKTLHVMPDEINGKKVTTVQLGVSHAL